MLTKLIELIISIACAALNVYNVLVLLYIVLKMINIPANKWTELLNSVVEPGLQIARKLMDRFLPSLRKPGIDWSPVVLFVSIIVVNTLLGWLI